MAKQNPIGTPQMIPAELIKKKRNGLALSVSEIDFFIQNYTTGLIPDHQMAALLMAIYFKGMSTAETLDLTKAMLHSGEVLSFDERLGFKVDKHSTGGVGDKTSLILGPIVAACGLAVPMISGRGLGHTGGTLDKLESIPGFNVNLSLAQFKKTINDIKISFIGQTKDICPADKKIYALRDITGTVESLPLICASIMSKKLAEGIDGLVLDVKFGTGAFMKTPQAAEELALALMGIAKGYGKKVSALLTNMDQPLGRFAGNALEVQECLDILQNKAIDNPFYQETCELSLQLAAKMLWLGGLDKDLQACYARAKASLVSGAAFEKFQAVCKLQGGHLERLPKAAHQLKLASPKSGYLAGFDCERIGMIGITLKAGRAQISDPIEPSAGIEFHFKIGAKVNAGDPVFTLFGNDLDLLKSVQQTLLATLQWSAGPVAPVQLIYKDLI